MSPRKTPSPRPAKAAEKPAPKPTPGSTPLQSKTVLNILPQNPITHTPINPANSPTITLSTVPPSKTPRTNSPASQKLQKNFTKLHIFPENLTPGTNTPKNASTPDPSSKNPTLSNPVGFIIGILGLPLYDWQARFVSWCEDVTKRSKISLVAPNGSGKSAVIIAGLVLWWLAAHRRGRVVITTKDSRQLDNQIEPAIRRHASKLRGWKFIERRIENGTGGFAVLFTTDEQGRAEGWHQGFLADGAPDPDAPLLIIVDEAKSVEDPIFEAIDRCTFNALAYVSSPGIRLGRFYDSQSANIGFRTMKAGLADCPHIPRERVDDIIRTYGADHPFTLSTLHGEFMDEDSDTAFIIPPSAVRRVVEDPPAFADGRSFAFCDFAAGGDECVLAHKRGNRVELTAWREANTMASVGRFIIEFTKRGLRPGEVYGDESGLGGPMIDRLAEAGWPINRVNNGATALNPARYENRGAEMWHTAGLVLQGAGCILPASDTKLHAQLSSRKMKPVSDGRIGVEKKADMKKRGLPSPDRADAVVGVLSIEAEIAASVFDAEGLRHLESRTREPALGTLTPADFGIHFHEDTEGWLQVWEQPVHGRAYLAVAKAGLGISAAHTESIPSPATDLPLTPISEDATDKSYKSYSSAEHITPTVTTGNSAGRTWSVFIFRKACTDEQGRSLPDAIVARIRPPCTWDAPFLAARIALLLKWYGNPVIVPDIRNALDLLEALRETGASIHYRPGFDRPQTASLSGNQPTVAYGWETDPKNLAVALSAIARAIRERTIDLPDTSAVNALRGCTRPAPDAADPVALGIALHSAASAQVLTTQFPTYLTMQPSSLAFTAPTHITRAISGACK